MLHLEFQQDIKVKDRLYGMKKFSKENNEFSSWIKATQRSKSGTNEITTRFDEAQKIQHLKN